MEDTKNYKIEFFDGDFRIAEGQNTKEELLKIVVALNLQGKIVGAQNTLSYAPKSLDNVMYQLVNLLEIKEQI